MSQRLNEQLCFALHSTAHAMNRAYRAPLKALGLTYPQYLCMLVLWERDGISVSAIGARLYLDSATLTPLLKRLAAMGLVIRQRAPDDERSVLVLLTPSGQALKHKARGIPPAIAAATNWSGAQVSELKSCLEALRMQLLRCEQGVG